VVLALPITVPASVVLWWLTSADYQTTSIEWASLVLLGVSSMYLGFFAWYRGLSQAGTAYGGQVQQLQALLTLVWSVLLLGEVVTVMTAVTAVIVVVCVAWALRSRASPTVAPEE
jgi:drug/metabolite transporter (DMT)-like permease